MAPLSFRSPGRSDDISRAGNCLGGMVIGVVVAGLGLFVVAVMAKHLMAGLGLLAAFRWIQDLALFGQGGAQFGLWLFLAATFVAVFLVIMLGLLPRLADNARERDERSVRTPGGPASWSSGWTAAQIEMSLDPPESEQPEHTRPRS